MTFFKYAAIGAAVGTLGMTAAAFTPAGAIPGALYGAATGGLIGGLSTWANNDFRDGIFNNGMIAGAVTGGILGGIAGYEKAVTDFRNPWTGAKKTSIEEVGGYEGKGKFLDGEIPAGKKPTNTGEIAKLRSNEHYGEFGWTRRYRN